MVIMSVSIYAAASACQPVGTELDLPGQRPMPLSPTPHGIDGHRVKAMQHTGLDRPTQTTLEAQDTGNFFDHRSQGVEIVSLHQSLEPLDDPPLAKGLE
jgi:hypothetical protein